MTDAIRKRLEELRAVHEAATPGPWTPREWDNFGDGLPPEWVTEFPNGDGDTSFTKEADARAIAAEHNAFAALLDVAEAAAELRDCYAIEDDGQIVVGCSYGYDRQMLRALTAALARLAEVKT